MGAHRGLADRRSDFSASGDGQLESLHESKRGLLGAAEIIPADLGLPGVAEDLLEAFRRRDPLGRTSYFVIPAGVRGAAFNSLMTLGGGE